MPDPEATLDLIADLRGTPRGDRRRRLARLARPTLEALALVLLDVEHGTRSGPIPDHRGDGS